MAQDAARGEEQIGSYRYAQRCRIALTHAARQQAPDEAAKELGQNIDPV